MSLREWEYEGSLAEAERHAVCRALRANPRNVTRAAAALRISRSSIYRLIERYDIDPLALDGADVGGGDLAIRVVDSVTTTKLKQKADVTLSKLLRRKRGFTLAKLARGLLTMRERANLFFGENQVDSDGINILFHLLASQAERKDVNVASCARAINATFPKTLRRVEQLESVGLVLFTVSITDARTSVITLTQTASAKLEAYISDII